MAKAHPKFDWLIFIHRYVGLILGLWLFAVGLTGSILAYYREIDVFLNPDLFAAKDSPQHPDLDAMLARVRAAYPDRFVLYLDRYALSGNETYPFILSAPLPRTDKGLDLSSIGNYDTASALDVFVDPRTTEIVGQRSHWTVINLMRDFHRELFLPGAGGRKVLGAVALTLFISTVVGGFLWWRDARKHTKRALTLRLSAPGPRLVRDGHTVFGAYAAVIIGWLSLAAAMICYETPLRNFSDWLLRPERVAQNFETLITNADTAVSHSADGIVSLNQARDTALTDHPNSDIVLIRMPKSAASRLSFRLYPTDQDKTIYTRQVYIDARTGKIVGRFDPARQPWTDSLFGVWLIWFHNGTMLGDVGRVFNIFAGLVLASLFPTGVYIWWKKRRARMPKKAASISAIFQAANHPAE
jgi:uncharacterized iron-regulated membrane protein